MYRASGYTGLFLRCLAALFAALAAMPASAQDFSILDRRIRITTVTRVAGMQQYVGVAMWLRADSIGVVNHGEERVVPIASIIRLEESRGRHSNARRGAVIGAGVGLVLGVVAVVGQETDPSADLGGGSAGVAIVVPFAMIGSGLIGSILGSRTETERWEEIPRKHLQSP